MPTMVIFGPAPPPRDASTYVTVGANIDGVIVDASLTDVAHALGTAVGRWPQFEQVVRGGTRPIHINPDTVRYVIEHEG
jgi:hypothetical protein